jgi:Protein of unknown function (DUF2752)
VSVAFSRTTQRRVIVTSCAVGVVALHIGAGVFFASHDPYQSAIFAQCPILALTGWECPGCGGTRAMYSLLHGDLEAAFRMNPLVLACYPTGALLLAAIAARSRPRASRILLWSTNALFVIALLYVGVVRNLLPQ